jgi:hypothetical protein
MKNSILFTIALLLFSTLISNAQSQFGIRGGTTLTNWQGYVAPIDASYDIKLGAFIGVGSEMQLSKNVSLTVAADLTLKGHTINGTLNSGRETISGKITTHSIYLDSPVTLNIYIDEKFYLKGGGIYSLLLSNKASSDLVVNGTPVKQTDDTKSMLQGQDFSYVVGVGFKTNNGVNLELTYESSIGNIVNSESYFSWYEAQNKVIRMGLTYYLKKGSK